MALSMLAWIGIQIVLTITASLLIQRPRVRRTGPGAHDAPTSEIGRSIPIIWGTCKVQPNVLYFGNANQYEFTRKGQPAGYTYHATIAVGLCWGPIYSLVDIILDNKSLRRIDDAGPSATTPAFPLGLTDGLARELRVDAQKLFGGPDKEGGIAGNIDFHFGTEDQIQHPLLTSLTLDGADETQSAWKRLCYAVFTTDDAIIGGAGVPADKGFYWGTSGAAKPVHFVLQRFPEPANPSGTNIIPSTDGYPGANPAEIIYEILTEGWWGLNVAPNAIDLASFQAAAEQLFDETFGLSMQATTADPADEMIAEVLRHIDGIVYTHPQTGLIRLDLVRADYNADSLPQVSPRNSRDIEFKRPTYRELPTGIKLRFTNNSSRHFVEDTSEWTNPANLEAAGEERTEVAEFFGITDPLLAGIVAFREGKQLTLPFARGTFKCDRRAFNLHQGSPFILTWPAENIEPIVCRVTTIGYGTLEDGEMTVAFAEDIFHADGTGSGTNAPPLHNDPGTPGGLPQIPDVFAVYTETADDATAALTISDPDSRVTAVEVRWTISGDATGAFGAWSGPPYTDTQPKVNGKNLLVEWQVSYTNVSGGTSVISGQHVFSASGAPAGPGVGPGGTPGLKLDLDPWALLATLLPNDTTGFCPDASGNANHATQSDSAKHLTLRTNVVNGRPALESNNSTDPVLWTPAFLNFALGSTLILVGRRNGAIEEHGVILALGTPALSAAQSLIAHYGGGASDGGVRWYVDQGGNRHVLGSPGTDWYILALRIASDSSIIPYFNGAAGSAFDPHNAINNTRGVGVGGDGANSGNVQTARVLVWNAVLTTEELEAELAALSELYDIALA